MKRACTLFAFVAVFSVANAAIAADSWIFQPSYYSHEPARLVQIGPPQNFGGPYYTRPQGDYIRSGYRNMNSHLYTPGGATDNVNVYESWFQVGSQY